MRLRDLAKRVEQLAAGGGSGLAAKLELDGLVLPVDSRNNPVPLGDPIPIVAGTAVSIDLYEDMADLPPETPAMNWGVTAVLSGGLTVLGGAIYPADAPNDIASQIYSGAADGTAQNFGGGGSALAVTGGEMQLYALTWDNADMAQASQPLTFDLLRIFVRVYG